MKIYKILTCATLSILLSTQSYASESATAPAQQLPQSSAITPEEYAAIVRQRDRLATILVETIECCKIYRTGWQIEWAFALESAKSANPEFVHQDEPIKQLVKDKAFTIPDLEILSTAKTFSLQTKTNVQQAASELALAESQLAHARAHRHLTATKESRVAQLRAELIKHQEAEAVFNADMEARKALIYKELFGQPGGAL